MTDEIKRALTRFENALASYWQTDGALNEVDDDRIYSLEKKALKFDRLVEEAREELVTQIEKALNEKRN